MPGTRVWAGVAVTDGTAGAAVEGASIPVNGLRDATTRSGSLPAPPKGAEAAARLAARSAVISVARLEVGSAAVSAALRPLRSAADMLEAAGSAAAADSKAVAASTSVAAAWVAAAAWAAEEVVMAEAAEVGVERFAMKAPTRRGDATA
jgi:hypothetical protein